VHLSLVDMRPEPSAKLEDIDTAALRIWSVSPNFSLSVKLLVMA